MTSDRTDDQILKDPSGQPSVEQNVGSIGGHDRLNEAPQASDELVDRMMAISGGVFERLYWRDGQPG